MGTKITVTPGLRRKPPKNIPLVKSLYKKTTGEIKKEINNSDLGKFSFIASDVNVPTILIKGVGRFCECGCGKQITGRWIKRKSVKGKTVSYYQKPKENERFATKACLNRIYNKKRDPLKSSSLHCELKLNVIAGVIPYREMKIYTGEKQKITIKITPEHKELWATLEQISRYRHIPASEKIQVIVT